ncbi:MAG: HAMP domain-containing protein, partial [Aliifodinibius sp.]|nr:HAMP domain-containing protein [Fodinibius sp.]
MNDQNSNNHTGVSRLPISPKRIASIRVWTDLLIVVVVFIFLSPILETTTARIVLASVTGIFAGSLFGYFLIQRGRTIIGMGFVIYGFLIGLTTIAVYVEGLGPFSIVAMLLVTVISVSYAIPIQRVIEALSAGIALGVFSLVFDINFRGAAFRLAAPPQLTSALWIITLVLVGIIFYFIARQFPFFSLRAKMITSFAVITILALAALGFLNSRSVKRVLTEEANQSLLNAAIQTEETLWQFINLNYQSIETEASLPIMAEYIYALENEEVMIEERLLDTLLALAQKDPDYISSYALLDLLGNVLADTQIDHISANEADLSFFTDTIGKNSTTMSPVEIDPFTFVPSIYFGTPVVSEGQTIGVLRVRYKADILQNIITRSNNRGGENSFAVLFDENLIHLAHGIAPETIFTTVAPLGNDIFEQLLKERRLPLKTQEETFLDLPDLEKNLLKAQTSPAGMAFFEASDIATGDLINQVVVLNMQDPEWLLAFFQPQEIYLAPIDSLANNTILLGLLSGLGAVVLGIVLTQILTAPILNLTETAEEVSKGNFQAKAQISTEDEIGILGQTFNKMTIQLQNLVTNLENQVEIRTKSLRNQTAQMQASA